MYIHWKKPDGSKVQTVLAAGIDAATHAAELQANGHIDATWTFTTSSMPLPAEPKPNPAIVTIDAQIAAIEQSQQRPMRDMAAGNGAVIDPFTQKTPKQLFDERELALTALRDQRKSLPKTV